MERSNVDVQVDGMEGPGGVGDDLCDLHQVELEDTIQVLGWDWGPSQVDEGGGARHRSTRGRDGSSSWNCNTTRTLLLSCAVSTGYGTGYVLTV